MGAPGRPSQAHAVPPALVPSLSATSAHCDRRKFEHEKTRETKTPRGEWIARAREDRNSRGPVPDRPTLVEPN